MASVSMASVSKTVLYLFVLLITFVSCRKDDQGPNPVLQEYWAVRGGGNYNEEIVGSAIDRNGNTYVVGRVDAAGATNDNNPTVTFGNRTYSVKHGYSIFFAKIDRYGHYEWVKLIENAPEHSYGSIIRLDEQGNVYIHSNCDSKILFDGIPIELDKFNFSSYETGFLAKCDNNGNLIWIKGLAGQFSPQSMVIDTKQDIYISGSSVSDIIIDGNRVSSVPQSQIYIAKFNAGGTLLWAKQDGMGCYGLYPSSMVVDISGNLYVAGSFMSCSQIGSNSSIGWDHVGFLAKYSNEGDAVWVRTHNGEGGNATAMVTDGSYIYTTGSYLNNSNGQDILLSKYDLDGKIKWVKQFGGPTRDLAYGLAIHDKTLYTTGSFSNTATFGDTAITASTQVWDSFVLEVDTDGQFNRVKQHNLRGGIFRNIDVDENRNIYLSGYFYGTIVVNGQSLTAPMMGATDAIIARIKSD